MGPRAATKYVAGQTHITPLMETYQSNANHSQGWKLQYGELLYHIVNVIW